MTKTGPNSNQTGTTDSFPSFHYDELKGADT